MGWGEIEPTFQQYPAFQLNSPICRHPVSTIPADLSVGGLVGVGSPNFKLLAPAQYPPPNPLSSLQEWPPPQNTSFNMSLHSSKAASTDH